MSMHRCLGAGFAMAAAMGCAVGEPDPGDEGAVLPGSAGSCAPGEAHECYSGPPGTEGVGICHGGKRSCNATGVGYGPCVGEQTPEPESCDAALRDEDCDGRTNAGSVDCPAQEIVTGGQLSCALLGGGAVKCWGGNDEGQLGLGDTRARGDEPGEMGSHLPAVNLGVDRKVRSLRAGTTHVCAVLDDGGLKCWGANFNGQLGLGDGLPRGASPADMGDNLPTVQLGAGVTVTAVATGTSHNCALLADARLKCWGSNYEGQLGLGDELARGDGAGEMGDDLAAVIPGVGDAVVTTAAGSEHTCALQACGSVKCWGSNLAGQLGLGDTKSRGDAPGELGEALPEVDLGPDELVVAITAGMAHTCALLHDGRVKCWGWNGYGQLGLGDALPRGDQPGEMGDELPVVDLGVGQVAVAVSAGFDHTCALLKSGKVKCWGGNYHGQLGLGDTMTRGTGPKDMGENLPAVDLGKDDIAVAVAAGRYHTCALLADGGIKCWGKNGAGELGLGDTNNRGDGVGKMGNLLPRVSLL